MTTRETGRRVGATAAGCPEHLISHRKGSPVNADPQFIASLSPAFADALQNSRHALLTDDPAQSLARVLATFHNEHRAELLREAEEICDEAGAAYTAKALNEQADGAYALMARFRRKAEEAEQTATVPAAGGVVSAAPDQADALVADARRAVHEALVVLAAPEADRVRALIADLETAVEGRTAMRFTAPPPADRAAVLREAADAVFALDYDVMVGEQGDENLGSMREAWDLGTIHATELLRRVAAEAPQPECSPACSEQHTYKPGCALADEAQQQEPHAAIARVRAVADGLERDAATPGVVEIVRPALRDAARQIRDALAGAEAQQQPDTETLIGLIRDFLDPDPCSFDHHGYCQAHAAGFGGEPMSCPHGRARKLLPGIGDEASR